MTTPAVIDNERIRIMMEVYEGTAGYQQIKEFNPEEVRFASTRPGCRLQALRLPPNVCVVLTWQVSKSSSPSWCECSETR